MASPPTNPLTRATTTNFGVVMFAAPGKTGPGLALMADDPRILALTGSGSGGSGGSTVLPKHASTHKQSGSDFIRLDELATPQDNTNLDATPSRHGLLSKLDKIKLDTLVPPPAFLYPQPIPCIAGAAIGSNSLIHIDGTGNAIKADAVLGRPAHAFTREALIPGQLFDAYQIGSFNGFSALAPGQDYWLGANGLITSIPPTTPSTINQRVGTGSAGDTLALSIELAIEISP